LEKYRVKFYVLSVKWRKKGFIGQRVRFHPDGYREKFNRVRFNPDAGRDNAKR